MDSAALRGKLHDAQDTVTGVCYAGGETARPTNGVLDAIAQADVLILAPSNPFASVLPILGLPGVREALRNTAAPVLAITPIVSGIPITDPGEAKRARSRAALMASAGLSHRAASVAGLYQDIVDIFVLDEADAHEKAEIKALGMEVTVSPTLLHREPVGVPSIELLLRRCLGSRR